MKKDITGEANSNWKVWIGGTASSAIIMVVYMTHYKTTPEQAFDQALSEGDASYMQKIIDKYGDDIDINKEDENGYTPLGKIIKKRGDPKNDRKKLAVLLACPSIDLEKKSMEQTRH